MKLSAKIVFCVALALAVLPRVAAQGAETHPALIDLAKARAMIEGDSRPLPTELRFDVLATIDTPAILTHSIFKSLRASGADDLGTSAFSTRQLAVTVFQVHGPWGRVMIDAGLGRHLGESIYDRVGKLHPFFQWNDDATFKDVRRALRSAVLVVFTHEHPDHIGTYACDPKLGSYIQHVEMTAEQRQGLDDKKLRACLNSKARETRTVPLKGIRLVAPGIVMAPAPGHSEGSAVFFVRLENKTEFLLIGDIAWLMDNIRREVNKSRLLFFFGLKEDWSKVKVQLGQLNDLMAKEPSLVVIPSHDLYWLTSLLAAGVLRGGLALD